MTADRVNKTSKAELILSSRMGDLAQVAPWIEHLASVFEIPASTEFAMNLCLEEALSNIIRHGYADQSDAPIVVRFAVTPNNSFQLAIEDQAPRFDPLAVEDTPIKETLDGTRIGGLGIRLMRRFAASIDYEATLAGNRLTIGFSTAE